MRATEIPPTESIKMAPIKSRSHTLDMLIDRSYLCWTLENWFDIHTVDSTVPNNECIFGFPVINIFLILVCSMYQLPPCCYKYCKLLEASAMNMVVLVCALQINEDNTGWNASCRQKHLSRKNSGDHSSYYEQCCRNTLGIVPLSRTPFYFALIRMRKSLTVTTFPLRDIMFVYVFPIVAVDNFFLIRSLNLCGWKIISQLLTSALIGQQGSALCTALNVSGEL